MMAALDKVDPAHYSDEYYLKDCDGWKEYLGDLDKNVHSKFERAIELAQVKSGQRILDIGCGRGEIAYYCAKEGANVVAIDYSSAAVAIARQTVSKLPRERQDLVTIEEADLSDFKPTGLFDKVFMIDVVEHIYDWQLKNILLSLKGHLSGGGQIIVSTPNANYERYLYPLKRFINYPYKPIKWALRMIRGKYKPKNRDDLLKRLFKVFPEKRDRVDIMHINVMTPSKMRGIFIEAGYDVKIRCDDHSYDIASLISKRWFGREIIAIAGRSKG